MATMTETSQGTGTIRPSHEYHGHASAFHGHLTRPFEQKIEDQAPVKLQDRRGGHFTRQAFDFNLEGVISFTKGETRVSGARSVKTNGWVTVSAAAVENMNVFDIITADRIVSQVATEHPYENGHVPHVTFLGTQYKGLQVSGFPVKLTLRLGFLGDRPANGNSYLHDRDFMERVKKQTKDVADARGLPTALKEQYDEKLRKLERQIETCEDDNYAVQEPITCSLVEKIDPIDIPGVVSYGHILVIPEFGTVSLGEVEVGEKQYDPKERPCVYFELKTIFMNMGCVAHGPVNGPSSGGNGVTRP